MGGKAAWGLWVAGALGPWAVGCSVDSRAVRTEEESLSPETPVVPSSVAVPAPNGVATVPSGSDGAAGPDGTGGAPGLDATDARAGGADAYRLTVVLSGARGKVTSSRPGIDCGTVCTSSFAGAVALSARAQNGQDSFFTGWSSSDPNSACNGAQQDCSILMDHDQTVTANFATMDHNLVFVSSKSYPPTLGGVTAYDSECNALASAAGINAAAGGGFIALMSDFADYDNPVGDVLDRLGAARGWVRADGLPVADEAASLVGPAQYYPPNLTEYGQVPTLGDGLVWTGLGVDAVGDDHCGRWTEARAGSRVAVGTTNAFRWPGDTTLPCDAPNQRIYCVGTTKRQPLETTRFEGKRVWVTTTKYAPGSSSPDQKCRSERPAGAAEAAAFIAYSGRPASLVIDPEATYVLSDGRRIGTGAQLLAAQGEVGAWLLADGTPIPGGFAWVGSGEAWKDPGTLDTTCRDWTSNDPTLSGDTEYTGFNYLGHYGAPSACSESWYLYCVEP